MKKVLFYPDPPIQHPGHTLSKTITYFKLLGYQLTNDINDDWDIAVNWNIKDVHDSPIELWSTKKKVLNVFCNNVLKSHVDSIFKEVFGYSSFADTSKYGYCVKKSNRQSAHDGEFIRTPCKQEKGWIYQKLIDNRLSPGVIYDIRLPVFHGEIPIIVIKARTVEGTFENSFSKNKRYWTAPVEEYLSRKETSLISEFCIKIGLDIGELDALRDNSTGKLYIIDVNNIPGAGLFEHVENGEALKNELAQFFKKQIE